MDIYDPQTVGIMVFGGFMVISALGIALVSTFSMKETSYEEALAKQRRELGKTQSARSEKKKKDKVSERKSRGKKKEEKPNGKIPEPEKIQEEAEADTVIEPAAAPLVAAAPVLAPAPEPVHAVEVKPTAVPGDTEPKTATEPSPALTEASPAPSPKEKKKKKVAKVEPASTQSTPVVAVPVPVKSSTVPASTSAPVSAPTKATSASAPAKSAPASNKSASASVKSASAPAPAKSAPAPAKPAAAPAKSSSAPSKTTPVLEAVTKEVPVMAVPPVGSQQAPAVTGKAQEPKKKASKKKSEPGKHICFKDIFLAVCSVDIYSIKNIFFFLHFLMMICIHFYNIIKWLLKLKLQIISSQPEKSIIHIAF